MQAPSGREAMARNQDTIARRARDLLQAAGAAREPVSLLDVVSALNLELVHAAREPFQSEAALKPLGDAHAIVLRGASDERRRRFTIAHEIGHFVLHPQAAGARARRRPVNAAWRQQEREADQFAAELLMPEHLVREAVLELGADAARLADRFDVSRAGDAGAAAPAWVWRHARASSRRRPLLTRRLGRSRRCRRRRSAVSPRSPPPSRSSPARPAASARGRGGRPRPGDEPCGRRQHGRQALAVREGHGVVVARVREQHARHAARGRDQVERLEERAQARPRRSGRSTRGSAVRRVVRCRRRSRARRAPASSEAPSAGQSSTSERKSLRPGARRQQQHAAAHAGPARRQPRRAGLGEQPLAGGDGVPPAVRRPCTPPLSPWPRKSNVSAASPAAAACSPMMLVVLLAAAGAVAHEQGAAGGVPAGRKSRPASSTPSRDDRERLGAARAAAPAVTAGSGAGAPAVQGGASRAEFSEAGTV